MEGTMQDNRTIEDLQFFLQGQRAVHIPTFEEFWNQEYSDSIVAELRKRIDYMRNNPENDYVPLAAEMTEKSLELYLLAAEKKEVVHCIVFQGFFQMILMGTLGGYVGCMKNYIGMMLGIYRTIEEERARNKIIAN
jgi:hypothetical protein